ncbi:hypothetical protein DPX16_16605 [Anabarilius grahami]|uniref:Uncharacterized protein n=1 Tax=Anabarilius grahami TaxID=495550 RepID=A0A3N0XX63_ANAGA|nr:hypothetical protein DPX16_16605 [Anabarilius grahami]
MEKSPAHTPAVEDVLSKASAVYEGLEEDTSLNLPSTLVLSSSKFPASQLVPPSFKSPVSPEIPPSLPLPPPLPKPASLSAPPLLFYFNSSVPPLTPLYCVDLPGVFLSPTLHCSTRDHHPYGSTELPRLSGSPLVRHRFACTTDFQAFSYASSLHPFGSVRLHIPSGSALVRSPTDSTSVLCHPSTLAPPCMLVAVAPPLCPVPSVSHAHFGSTSLFGSPPPLAQSPSVIPLVSSAKSPPWLLPPSTLLWAFILAVLWVPI